LGGLKVPGKQEFVLIRFPRLGWNPRNFWITTSKGFKGIGRGGKEKGILGIGRVRETKGIITQVWFPLGEILPWKGLF